MILSLQIRLRVNDMNECRVIQRGNLGLKFQLRSHHNARHANIYEGLLGKVVADLIMHFFTERNTPRVRLQTFDRNSDP